MTLRMALAGCVLLLVTACGKTPQQQVEAVQAALNAGDFATARATAEAALGDEAVKADKAISWRLEKQRLDALAGSKQAAEILATLKRLEPTYPAQLDAPLYATLTGKLSQARDHVGAIDILHAGIEKFPEKKALFEAELKNLSVAAAEAAKSGDNAALEKLKSLGYL